jgi:4-oxalocrotonate tautomerase
MPIIEMHLMEGRGEDQKQKVATAVTAAVVEGLGVKPQSVRILITEHKNEEFYVAGSRIEPPITTHEQEIEAVVGDQPA